MEYDNSQQAFFSLVRAGLWESGMIHDSCLMGRDNSNIDWHEVYQLAAEQSVVGLVLAGIERLKSANINLNLNQELLLQWIGEVQMIEHQNAAMNVYLNDLLQQLRASGMYPILVKGQGIAQCYEKPLWRTCGDIDLLLGREDYEKAKKLLLPKAESVETEYTYFKHIGMVLNNWVVELHGTLQSRLSKKIDNELDAIQDDVIRLGNARVWRNGETDVYLPAPDAGVIFIFTHYLHHFFFEGVGLRQICDWCRLLWTYKNSLNHGLLEHRLRKMGLMSEWRAFAAFAVEWLGMPVEAMPLYTKDYKWSRKAYRIKSYILRVGNFGHNQTSAITNKQPYLVRKFISFWVHACFTLRHFPIFPKDAIVFFGQVFRSGLHAVVRGE